MTTQDDGNVRVKLEKKPWWAYVIPTGWRGTWCCHILDFDGIFKTWGGTGFGSTVTEAIDDAIENFHKWI